MKKLLCAILCLIFVFGLTACGEEKQVVKRYELAQAEIPKDNKIAITDEDGKEWLENKHIDMVMVCYEEDKSRYLELRLNEDGIKAFRKALKRKKGELSITLNGEMLASSLIKHEKYEDSAIVLGEYKDIMNYFNTIKR